MRPASSDCSWPRASTRGFCEAAADYAPSLTLPRLTAGEGPAGVTRSLDNSRNQTPSPVKRGRVGKGAAPQRTNFELDPRALETL